MSEAIDRVAAFVDVLEPAQQPWFGNTPHVGLPIADLREVLRLARIGAEVVQRREVIIGALGPCGDAYHDPDAYAEHGDDCPTCATQDEALKALEPLL